MRCFVFLLAVFILVADASHAAPYIIREGKAQAEIVVAPERPRMATLAALELQKYLEKMSGARLPIVTEPGTQGVARIYVGNSPGAQKRGITDRGLAHGAFRMVSGADWLVLVGRDVDFVPPEPWPRNRKDGDRAWGEWDELTGDATDAAWGYPFSSLFKGWWRQNDFDALMAAQYGADNRDVWDQGEGSAGGWWLQDQGGSLNAVYAFLRTVGVRWYMPREPGEVVPERNTIALPELNRTVRPDFPLRYLCWYNYAGFSFEDVMWGRRLGLNSGNEILGLSAVHGLGKVHSRAAMKEAHPDYYALIAGARDTTHRGTGTACFSSTGLVVEAVSYARFMYDRFDQPHVSLWPQDGFRQCGCELCRGKSPSELVWGFVDRVARELYRTHPDCLVSCGAYTPYVHPPAQIEKFSPNVVVFIASIGRPGLDHPELWARYWERMEAWREKVAPGHVIRNSNNRYSLHGKVGALPFPVIHTRMMAKDHRAMKGVTLGDWNEVGQRRARWYAPGLDHLNLYVQARFLWDAEQDLDALLDDYVMHFYGPARDKMREALTYAEARYSREGSPHDVAFDVRIRFLEMLQAARDIAGNTVYGERIQLMLDELEPIDVVRERMKAAAAVGHPRDHAPVAIAAETPEAAPQYRLKDIVTGEEPEPGTTFRVWWDGSALVFRIRCEEPDMDGLRVTQDVYSGDSVALLLESPQHSYYQLEISPDGRVFDADRKYGVERRWKSMAEVEPERGAAYWQVTVRVPVASPETGAESDPFHYVVGTPPTAEKPWFFNVGRVRTREDEKRAYTFAPVGAMNYHAKDKFAKLAAGVGNAECGTGNAE